MATARVSDHLGNVARPLHWPFEFFGELSVGRLAVELSQKDKLGVLVIGRGVDQQLGIAHGGRLVGDGLVHLGSYAPLGKRREVAFAAAGEGADSLYESDRSLLDQVLQREALICTTGRKPNDQAPIN